MRSRIAQAMREDILKALAKSVMPRFPAAWQRCVQTSLQGLAVGSRERWYQLLPEVDVEEGGGGADPPGAGPGGVGSSGWG